MLRREIDAGRQAYVVYPLIEESEALSAKAATIEAENLQQNVFMKSAQPMQPAALPRQFIFPQPLHTPSWGTLQALTIHVNPTRHVHVWNSFWHHWRTVSMPWPFPPAWLQLMRL